MREILFRAKRIYKGEWIYGNLVIDINGEPHIVEPKYFYEDGHHLVYEDETDIPVFVIPETISQYTGLTDKNGKKIFENDIVILPEIDEKFLVEWDVDQAAFVIESDTSFRDFNNYRSTESEVIGNVFDNSDLLKESEE